MFKEIRRKKIDITLILPQIIGLQVIGYKTTERKLFTPIYTYKQQVRIRRGPRKQHGDLEVRDVSLDPRVREETYLGSSFCDSTAFLVVI